VVEMPAVVVVEMEAAAAAAEVAEVTKKIQLNKDYLEEWKLHPITQILFKHLDAIKTGTGKEMEALMYNAYQGKIDKDGVHNRMLIVAGRNEAIKNILDLYLLNQYIEWEEKKDAKSN